MLAARREQKARMTFPSSSIRLFVRFLPCSRSHPALRHLRCDFCSIFPAVSYMGTSDAVADICKAETAEIGGLLS